MLQSVSHRFSPRVWLFAGVVLWMVTWVSAQSDEKKSASRPASPSPSKRGNPADESLKVMMTPERQAAALKFAELHHPELYHLLLGLKQARQAEYQQAIRQLYNDSERLARLKERVPSRYEFVLAEWQLDSRLRLLIARMTMISDDPELAAQLQDLLKKRYETRLGLLKMDRERQAAKLAKLDDQIQALETDRELALQKDLSRIQRSLGIPKRNAKKQTSAKTKSVRKGN